MDSFQGVQAVSPTASANCAAVYVVHDDTYFLSEAIASITVQSSLPVFVFVSRVSWHGAAGDWESAAKAAEAAGATVVLGDWAGEVEQRQAAQDHLLAQGFTHALIPDGDEVIEPPLLQALLQIAETGLAERVYVTWDTYWKSPEYVIRPREGFTPCYLVDLRQAKPVEGRHFEGGRPLFLGAEYGIVHHLSWVGPERRIQRKLATWGHAREVLPRWSERVWRRWDRDKFLLRDLHPTHPAAYSFAERSTVPDILLPALEKYRTLADDEERRVTLPLDGGEPLSFDSLPPLPTVSVIIPVYGNPDDLRLCLASLAPLSERGLLHQVLVVDDGTPEPEGAAEIAEVAAAFPFVMLLKQPINRGFAATCNAGAASATGQALLFLNSDTVVPEAGFLRLVEALHRGGPLVAAVGPFTNRSGHQQQVDPTYTSLSTLGLFAEDFARRPEEDAPDRDTDMLVGFCLLVRKDAFDAVGGNFDERFGVGTFEDNDLCYRLRRQGYRLLLASRSFVHHAGSKTLTRVTPNVSDLLTRNLGIYQTKWRDDVESGFASHLSGLASSPEARIVFDPAKHPDLRLQAVRRRAQEADISLIMIVKNEERVLGTALESAKPFFREMIVVDTGSTDRTVEIAEGAGAKVFPFPWTDSFSEARNESLRHARGKWVFWLDADDTLPFATGEALLNCALSAPPDIAAFVVPVQFVETDNGDGTRSPGGTRVDHVKLIRNLPGLAFEGRIHEQILPSLRRVAGEEQCQIARAPEGAVVLHTGYDTTAEGQKKKRARDAKLLQLDLDERPDHPFVLFNLGMTDHYGGEHEGAIRWLRECLAASGEGESHVRKAYALLAVSLRELGRPDECLAMLEEGLAKVGPDPELHFQAGFVLSALGRYAESRKHYEQAVQADTSSHFSSVDQGILGYKTFHNLGQVCLLMEDYAAAKEWWTRAIEAAPAFLPSAFGLFAAAVAAKPMDGEGARFALSEVERAEGLSENFATMAAQLAEAEEGGNPEEGVAFLERLVEARPDAVAVRLVLARRLLATEQPGEEERATPHLVSLAKSGVAEGAFCLGVCKIRRGDYMNALYWMNTASELNPQHEQTKEQIDNLKQSVSALKIV